jgi:hypothetical protein
MSFGFSCPPCLRAANPGVCCYSRIWRFGGSSRCSGGNRAGPNSATRIVCCGSPSDGCGRNGRRGCSSANPKLSALGIGWVFICSGIGDPVPAAADPPLIANSSTSFGKCGPAIPHGAAHAFKPNWPNSELLYRIPPSVSITANPTRRPNLKDFSPQPRQGPHRRGFLCRPDRHLPRPLCLPGASP